MKIVTIPYRENYRLNIIGAICLTLMSIYVSFFSLYFLTGLILPILILAKRKGLQIDPSQNKYREYTKTFNKIRGEWKSLDQFKNIVVLSKRGAKTATGTLMTGGFKVKGEFHEVYLMDENHLKRIYLESFDDLDLANRFAKNTAEKINVPLLSFNPKTSKINIKKRQ